VSLSVESAPAGNQSLCPRTLYSRPLDGGHPVHTLPDRYEVDRPSGTLTFPSRRALLIHLTGHPKARNWTFDRYFRQGRWAPPRSLGRPLTPLLEWFRPVSPSGQETRPVVGGVVGVKVEGSGAVTISPATAQLLASRAVAEAEADPELGIDLVNRSGEVVKLLFAGFGSWIHTSGFDPEEVVQEVFLGMVVRNQGRCPWDGRKSSFGHYVHMVCNGVLSNYHRKVKRVRIHERPGVWGYNAQGEWQEMDVGEANLSIPAQATHVEVLRASQDLLMSIPEGKDTALAKRILPYVRDGYTRTDIARELGVPRVEVTGAWKRLGEWAVAWRGSGFAGGA